MENRTNRPTTSGNCYIHALYGENIKQSHIFYKGKIDDIYLSLEENITKLTEMINANKYDDKKLKSFFNLMELETNLNKEIPANEKKWINGKIQKALKDLKEAKKDGATVPEMVLLMCLFSNKNIQLQIPLDVWNKNINTITKEIKTFCFTGIGETRYISTARNRGMHYEAQMTDTEFNKLEQYVEPKAVAQSPIVSHSNNANNNLNNAAEEEKNSQNQPYGNQYGGHGELCEPRPKSDRTVTLKDVEIEARQNKLTENIKQNKEQRITTHIEKLEAEADKPCCKIF